MGDDFLIPSSERHHLIFLFERFDNDLSVHALMEYLGSLYGLHDPQVVAV